MARPIEAVLFQDASNLLLNGAAEYEATRERVIAWSEAPERCALCDGSGYQSVTMTEAGTAPCDRCGGTGEVLHISALGESLRELLELWCGLDLDSREMGPSLAAREFMGTALSYTPWEVVAARFAGDLLEESEDLEPERRAQVDRAVRAPVAQRSWGDEDE